MSYFTATVFFQKMIPSDNTMLVLGTKCDNVGATKALPDAQMLFSFIPSELNIRFQEF